MTTARVRCAEPADAEIVGRMLHEFNREFGEATPPAQAVAERIRKLLVDGAITVLLTGGGPEGLAILRFHPSLYEDGLDWYVEELYVVPARRGEGIGRELMEAAIELARRDGAIEMHLGTGEDDVAARGLYESLGFSNRESNGAVTYFYDREL